MGQQLGRREEPGQVAKLAIGQDGRQVPADDPGELLALGLVPQIDLIGGALQLVRLSRIAAAPIRNIGLILLLDGRQNAAEGAQELEQFLLLAGQAALIDQEYFLKVGPLRLRGAASGAAGGVSGTPTAGIPARRHAD